MSAEMSTKRIHDELVAALGGIDHRLPLDSLQSVAVMSYLRNRGFDVPFAGFANRPRTVEEWVLWAGRHSSGS
jgi:aryl carrier-like protein